MAKLRVTFLSNGHGEDRIAASLALEFRKQQADLELFAFPSVDEGKAYEDLNIEILGPRKIMPSSGLLMHNWQLFKQDIKAGFLAMTLAQLRDLSHIKSDVLVVVGDAFALLLSALIKTRKRFYVQTLVSAHHAKGQEKKQVNRFFMEHVSYPERLLIRHMVEHVYVRDKATAQLLEQSGLKQVSALGNPMLDGLEGQPMPLPAPIITLLPGSRAYADKALTIMLESLCHLDKLTVLVAWAGQDLPKDLGVWQPLALASEQGLVKMLRYKENRVYIFKDRFADCLHSAQLVIGTSGTANEQAAALGKPVLAFPVPPLYSPAFLSNQKRLLADALTLVPAEPRLIARALEKLLKDELSYQRASELGKVRMGKAGGSAAIVHDILERIG